MSQLSDLANETCELDMTPMIDVTFLLLIFFMCTLKFKTLEGKLSAFLPKDVGVNQSDAEPKEKVEVLMRPIVPGTKYKPAKEGEAPALYTGTGRFVYGPDRVIQYSVGILRTNDLGAIAKRLKVIHKDDPERALTIDARPGTIYGDVIECLDVVLDADFTDITFVGAYPDKIK